jgi:hypothetical protein
VLIENSQGFKTFEFILKAILEKLSQIIYLFLKIFFEKMKESKNVTFYFLYKPMQACLQMNEFQM